MFDINIFIFNSIEGKATTIVWGLNKILAAFNTICGGPGCLMDKCLPTQTICITFFKKPHNSKL